MKTAALVCLGLLALSLVPVSGHAQMPGDKCELERLGTTKRANDDQNIIACLKTGEKTQDGKDDSEWKAMTSSGGGGITGGCSSSFFLKNNFIVNVEDSWGKGCSNKKVTVEKSVGPGVLTTYGSYCKVAADVGYMCGLSNYLGNDFFALGICQCVKK